MVRPLVIDDEAKAIAARVIAHAEAHPYHPRPGSTPPGDDPNFVAKLGTYRAVFTITHSDRMVFRHLSISVPGKGFPNPLAVMLIGELFGFTGIETAPPNKSRTAGWFLSTMPSTASSWRSRSRPMFPRRR